jgi:HAD superfamily hydrolase (TIGR01509 family)
VGAGRQPEDRRRRPDRARRLRRRSGGAGRARDLLLVLPPAEPRPLSPRTTPTGPVVFDCDGLLLDTEGLWTRAETALFARHGLPFGPAEKAELLGTSTETSGRILERLLGRPGDAPELGRELDELVFHELRDGVEARPGARELVGALAGRRRLGIASNSTGSWVEWVLEAAGFTDRFEVVVTAEDVAAPKPAPDVYLRAAELLGSPAADTVALEDSPPGSAAARAAGAYVIGVPYLAGQALEADLVVDSLADEAVAAALGLRPFADLP